MAVDCGFLEAGIAEKGPVGGSLFLLYNVLRPYLLALPMTSAMSVGTMNVLSGLGRRSGAASFKMYTPTVYF